MKLKLIGTSGVKLSVRDAVTCREDANAGEIPDGVQRAAEATTGGRVRRQHIHLGRPENAHCTPGRPHRQTSQDLVSESSSQGSSTEVSEC